MSAHRDSDPQTGNSPSPGIGKVLIAGAGYVGTELLRLLRDRGIDASGVRRRHPEEARHIHACDITDPRDLEQLSSKLGRLDAVVHCASSDRGGPEAYHRVFLDGTTRLFEVLAPEHFFFVSSTSVYPQLDGSEVDERSETRGSRETSRILLEAEEEIRRRSGTVARCSGLFGPGRSVVLRRFLMGEARIDSEGPMGRLEDGRLLNQIHRDDAASGIAFLLARGELCRGEIFNLSDTRPMSQGEIYRGLVARFGGSLPPRGQADNRGKRAWTHKAVSSARLRGLGWEPQYPDYLTALDADRRIVASIQEQVAFSLSGE